MKRREFIAGLVGAAAWPFVDNGNKPELDLTLSRERNTFTAGAKEHSDVAPSKPTS